VIDFIDILYLFDFIDISCLSIPDVSPLRAPSL
jgi:hypothetical protein